MTMSVRWHARNRRGRKEAAVLFPVSPAENSSATACLWHNKTFVIGLCASEVEDNLSTDAYSRKGVVTMVFDSFDVYHRTLTHISKCAASDSKPS